MIRFDAAYHGLFKTNRKQVADYPNLSSYMERILNLPGVVDTVGIDSALQQSYYSIKELNPAGIRPTGPAYIEAMIQVSKETRSKTG
ncbi:hypothetical protein P4S64_18585 [Vibrio sp. M60_M31a]